MPSSLLHHPSVCPGFSQPLKEMFGAGSPVHLGCLSLPLALSELGSRSSCFYPPLDGDNKPFLSDNTRNTRKGRWAAMGWGRKGGVILVSFFLTAGLQKMIINANVHSLDRSQNGTLVRATLPPLDIKELSVKIHKYSAVPNIFLPARQTVAHSRLTDGCSQETLG